MESVVCSICKSSKPNSEYYLLPDGKRNGRKCKACKKKSTAQDKRARNNWPGERTVHCRLCGAGFTSIKTRAYYCSRGCKDLARVECRSAERAALKASRVRRCQQCGSAVSPDKRADAKFCSEQCNSAAHNFTRKLARRTGTSRIGTVVSRAAIAERDRWRCQLCRKRIDPKLRHPHPLCLSIDHLVPVADLGDNDPANLQATHLVCNLRKRDRGPIQQLALFG